MPEKSTHGGKRKGAGRKKGKPTAVISVRTTEERKKRFDSIPHSVRRSKIEALIDDTCPH